DLRAVIDVLVGVLGHRLGDDAVGRDAARDEQVTEGVGLDVHVLDRGAGGDETATEAGLHEGDGDVGARGLARGRGAVRVVRAAEGDGDVVRRRGAGVGGGFGVIGLVGVGAGVEVDHGGGGAAGDAATLAGAAGVGPAVAAVAVPAARRGDQGEQ